MSGAQGTTWPQHCPPHLGVWGTRSPANLPAASWGTPSRKGLSDTDQSLAKNQEAEAKAEPQHPVAYVCCELRRAAYFPPSEVAELISADEFYIRRPAACAAA